MRLALDRLRRREDIPKGRPATIFTLSARRETKTER
jgi:hypothetical protein